MATTYFKSHKPRKYISVKAYNKRYDTDTAQRTERSFDDNNVYHQFRELCANCGLPFGSHSDFTSECIQDIPEKPWPTIIVEDI
jgi:hypothetical protein